MQYDLDNESVCCVAPPDIHDYPHFFIHRYGLTASHDTMTVMCSYDVRFILFFFYIYYIIIN